MLYCTLKAVMKKLSHANQKIEKIKEKMKL